MKRSVLILLLAASGVLSICSDRTQALNDSQAGRSPARQPQQRAVLQLPPGVPPVRGVVKTAFSLRYQDVKIGTGKEAEPNKLYKVQYTGWLAADGHKFDSSYDHRTPVIGADGKPELDESGKPKMGDPQPISIPQGFGRVIPGFDQGFTGMKVGGKRRLFIPWQLAYGARGRPGPDAAHPGIPPKADLIFDVELVDVSDMQLPTNHPGMPGMGGMPGGHPMPMPHPGAPGAAPMPGPPASTPPSGTPASPAAPGTSVTPATSPAATPAHRQLPRLRLPLKSRSRSSEATIA